MEQKGIKTLVGATEKEIASRDFLSKSIRNSPIPDSELYSNIGLYTNRQTLSRILLMNEIYKKIIDVHGVIIEFGVRWGQNLALFASLRGMYEPYNYNRKIIGFDTFEGFPEIDNKDGNAISVGDYGVTAKYYDYLNSILEYHESVSPIQHKKKYELIKGDATKTIHEYVKNNPQTLVAFAYFDFDIYKPTKECLQAILPRMSKGSIIAFDELNCPEFPGETIAILETLNLNNFNLKRDPNSPLVSYIVI